MYRWYLHKELQGDGDAETYSELSLGLVGVAASIEQTIYFEGDTNATDTYELSFRLDPSLLALGVLNAIEIIGQEGDTVLYSERLDGLINLEILGLLQNYEMVSLKFADSPSQTSRDEELSRFGI